MAPPEVISALKAPSPGNPNRAARAVGQIEETCLGSPGAPPSRSTHNGAVALGDSICGQGRWVMRRRSTPSLLVPASAFAGYRYAPEVIVLAVRWYLRYNLSYRDLEELLAERGIVVDHVTLYRWVTRFTPLLIDAARFTRHAPGDRWFADETYVKVSGKWTYLYRAVDQFGQVIDVMASQKRDWPRRADSSSGRCGRAARRR
jgi:transposase InsO family protein